MSLIAFDPKTLTRTGDWRQIFGSDTSTNGRGILAYCADKLYLTLGDHYTSLTARFEGHSSQISFALLIGPSWY